MAYIASWLNDHLQAKQANLVVDDTLTNLRHRSGLLDAYVPMQTYSGRKFLSYVMKEINTVASLVSYGAEIPTTSVGTFRKITAEMLKSGLTYLYDEQTQWDMKEAMEAAMNSTKQVQDSRMPDGSIVPGTDNDLAKHLFGTIERLVKSQIDLLDSLTWQVLQTGTLSRTDYRTREVTNLDYRNAYDNSYNHFPSALAGNDRWDQYATANGIQDLYSAVSDFVDTNGFKPDIIAMSWKLHNDLMQQTSTKNAASSLTVTQVGQVSPDLLLALLRARGLPEIVLFDEQYEIEDSAKVVSKARFLNTNRFVFLSKNMGQRAMGPTLEGDGKTGVYVVTREVQKFPPTDATTAVATMIPVFANPKLFYSRQVKD